MVLQHYHCLKASLNYYYNLRKAKCCYIFKQRKTKLILKSIWTEFQNDFPWGLFTDSKKLHVRRAIEASHSHSAATRPLDDIWNGFILSNRRWFMACFLWRSGHSPVWWPAHIRCGGLHLFPRLRQKSVFCLVSHSLKEAHDARSTGAPLL